MTNVSLSAANLTTNATFYNEMYELYKTKRDGKRPTTFEQRLPNLITTIHKSGPFTNEGSNIIAMLPLSDIGLDNFQNLTGAPSEPFPHPDTSISKGYQAQLKILLRHLATPNMAGVELSWINEVGGIIFAVMHPLSRGSVTANSSSLLTNSVPTVNTRYLTHPLDTRISIETFKYNRKIAATGEMQEMGAVEVSPGPGVNTDEQFEGAIRDGPNYMYHMTGTCSMMKKELGGVVDTELRVYGVQNLRVVDASVQPLIPAAHLQTTVYAVAERVSIFRHRVE